MITVLIDMLTFVDELETADDFDPKQFRVNMTRETAIERLKKPYEL